jgi:PLD-like domain
MISNSEPFVDVSFNIKNKSDTQIQTLFSAHCEINLAGSAMLDMMLPPGPLDGRWLGGNVAQHAEIDGYVNSMSVSKDPIKTNMPTVDVIHFQSRAKLSNYTLIAINNAFEQDATIDRLKLDVRIIMPTLLFTNPTALVSAGGRIIKFETTDQLSRRDWMQWLQSWGYQTTLMYLPTSVYEEIKTQMRERGYTKEWEAVYAAMRSLKKSTVNVNLLRGNSYSMIFEDRIRDRILNSKKDLFMIMTVIDTTLVNEIEQTAKRGVDVKLIIGTRLDKKEMHGKNGKYLALTRLKKILNVKLKEGFHGRMIVADNYLIVGSVDLDRQGLTVHDNLAIETDEPTAVNRAKELFYDVLGESEDLSLDSK